MNGIRAIAAIAVLVGHCFQDTFGDWGIPECSVSIIVDPVTIFFVLSGFLITFLLIKENKETSKTNIKKFYLRRILRIWPIYFGYLFFSLFILYLCNKSADILNNTLFYYIFFTANIPFLLHNGIWVIVHYWSISVEEQFYLFWPWLTKYVKNNLNKLLIFSVSLYIFWIFGKYGSYIITGKSVIYRFFSVTRFDCMMLGAIGSILFYQNNKKIGEIISNKIIASIVFILLLFSVFYVKYIPAPLVSQYIAILAILFILNQQTTKPIISLENNILDFIGKISYGIYVIHPIIIFILSQIYRELDVKINISLQYTIIYSSVILITIFFSWISYNYYEIKFLKLKSKYAVIKSKV